MKRQCHDLGSSPGPPLGDVGNMLAHTSPPFVDLNVCNVLGDAPAAFVPSHIAAPTVQELSHALAMGSSVNFENSGECFRVLFAQNHLLLRAEIHRSHPYSTVSLGNNSGSRRALSSSPLLSSSSNSSGNPRPLCISPPKKFQCPVCFTFNNEKDFDRHVKSWIKKCTESGPVKSGVCPGIRSLDHLLLQNIQVQNGTLQDSVQLLVSDIRSLVRPGAYDSMSEQGSGRHLDVARRIAELQRPRS